MTIEGWEGFVAVEEVPGSWAIYYDQDDDGLKSKVSMGTRILEVELIRREKKERKPEPDAEEPETLSEKMEQHKAQTQQTEAERQQFLASQTLEDDDPQMEVPRMADGPASHGIIHELSDEVQRLKLAIGSLADEPKTTAGAQSHPPSVITNVYSAWSESHNDADSESMTVASSVFEADESLQSRSPGGLYKAPTVEDDG